MILIHILSTRVTISFRCRNTLISLLTFTEYWLWSWIQREAILVLISIITSVLYDTVLCKWWYLSHISYTFIIPISINTCYCKIMSSLHFACFRGYVSMVTGTYSLCHTDHADLISLFLNCLHLSVRSIPTHPHHLIHQILRWFPMITPILVPVQPPLVTIPILVKPMVCLASTFSVVAGITVVASTQTFSFEMKQYNVVWTAYLHSSMQKWYVHDSIIKCSN